MAVVHDERFGDDTVNLPAAFGRMAQSSFHRRLLGCNLVWQAWNAPPASSGDGRRHVDLCRSAHRQRLRSRDGLQVAFEGVHDARGSDHAAHFYRTPALYLARRLAGYSTLMPSDLAEFLIHIGTQGWQRWASIEAIGPRRSDQPGYLTSWLLAPPAAARQRPLVRAVPSGVRWGQSSSGRVRDYWSASASISTSANRARERSSTCAYRMYADAT